MITFYLFDEQRIYTHSVEQSKYEAVPVNSTMIAPPELVGDEVAQWNGHGWTVLPERPPAPPAPPEPVPQSVTQRQARLCLFNQGILSDVDAIIDAMPEPDRSIARIEWDWASEIVRNSPLVAALGAALGVDDDGLDDLFRTASTL